MTRFNHQQAAEHYNSMIWKVFSVGVSVSAFILYKHLKEDVSFLVLTFGLVVLLYSFMLIISFGEQRTIHRSKLKIYGNYLKARHIGEVIIFMLTFAYFIFWFDNIKPTPFETFLKSFPVEFFSLIGVLVIIILMIYNLHNSKS